jgi:murein DD-endopeptidase MepM/ murein hydrolase activator NlpD
MAESRRGSALEALLEQCRDIAPVLPYDLAKTEIAVLDFSSANRDLDAIDTGSAEEFTDYVTSVLHRREASVGVGRYNEERVTYRHSALFAGTGERRSVHLGIDLFVEHGTSVSTPLAATIHSFANNQGLGDYGPTIILQHELQDVPFWTLYGHLALESLGECHEGKTLSGGSVFGRVGGMDENGGWPPHLHFQIITEIGKWKGDFPGVAAPSRRRHFLGLCPDPNLILGIPGL